MARRPGTAKGGQTARERYYNAQAKKVEMENKRRAGDLVEAAAMEARYGQLVTAFATELQNLAGTAVQQGILTREREADLQALVDRALTKLSERRLGA